MSTAIETLESEPIDALAEVFRQAEEKAMDEYQSCVIREAVGSDPIRHVGRLQEIFSAAHKTLGDFQAAVAACQQRRAASQQLVALPGQQAEVDAMLADVQRRYAEGEAAIRQLYQEADAKVAEIRHALDPARQQLAEATAELEMVKRTAPAIVAATNDPRLARKLADLRNERGVLQDRVQVLVEDIAKRRRIRERIEAHDGSEYDTPEKMIESEAAIPGLQEQAAALEEQIAALAGPIEEAEKSLARWENFRL